MSETAVFESSETEAKEKDTAQSSDFFPFAYIYLVMLLSALTGQTSSEEIASFWTRYRPALKEIFSDFPDSDIPEVLIRRVLMLTSRHSLQELPKEVLGGFIKEGRFLNDDEEPCFSSLLNLEVDPRTGKAEFSAQFVKNSLNGIVIVNRARPSIDSDQLNDDELDDDKQLDETERGHRRSPKLDLCPNLGPLDLDSTIVTFDSDQVEPADSEDVIYQGADYFIGIGHKAKLWNALLKAFETENPVSSFETIQEDDTQKITYSIRALPAANLPSQEIEEWTDLSEGTVLKVTVKIEKKGGQEEERGESNQKITQLEHFFLSSFRPDNPLVAQQGAHAIWGHGKETKTTSNALYVDFFQDVSQVKNALYLRNQSILQSHYKDYFDRINNFLYGQPYDEGWGEEYEVNAKEAEEGIKRLEKTESVKEQKQIFCAVLSTIVERYDAEERANWEAEDRDSHPWEY